MTFLEGIILLPTCGVRRAPWRAPVAVGVASAPTAVPGEGATPERRENSSPAEEGKGSQEEAEKGPSHPIREENSPRTKSPKPKEKTEKKEKKEKRKDTEKPRSRSGRSKRRSRLRAVKTEETQDEAQNATTLATPRTSRSPEAREGPKASRSEGSKALGSEERKPCCPT